MKPDAGPPVAAPDATSPQDLPAALLRQDAPAASSQQDAPDAGSQRQLQATPSPQNLPAADSQPEPAGSTQPSRKGPLLSPREVVVVTGISGSGKSVALHALEDAGFFCVDNLPPELLREFLRVEQQRSERRVAIAVDARNVGSLPQMLTLLNELRGEGVLIRSVFLDASTDTLVRRFSETRRMHPLTPQATDPIPSRRREDLHFGHRALVDAIELERELLSGLREVSTVVDTSQLRPGQLRAWMRNLVEAAGTGITLVFESFAFKQGVPLDADFVFDVRVLPNPHYIRELRPQTGRDAAVADYLEQQPEVLEMLAQIEAFLGRWLPAFQDDQRSYLTVAIGCTGGQHRSVYFVEALSRRFATRAVTLVRHRELDALD